MINFWFIKKLEMEVPVIWREKGGKISPPSKRVVEKSAFSSHLILILEVGGRNGFVQKNDVGQSNARALISASLKAQPSTIVARGWTGSPWHSVVKAAAGLSV